MSRLRLKCDGTRAETSFRLSAKRTSPFKTTGASVQSTTGSRGVGISGSNAVYTKFRGSVKGFGWLPTPFASFSFTSPLVRRRVPSRFNWTLRLRRDCISMEQISYPYWEVILVFGDGVLSVITEYPYGSSIKFISLQMLVGVSRSMCYFEGCFPHALYAERLNWEKVYVVPAHGLEGNRRRNEQPKHSSSRY